MSLPEVVPVSGVYVAPVTPMNANLTVDVEGLRALVDFLIESGVHGLTPGAVTAEVETLSLAEHRQVLAAATEAAAGRVPVYAGIGRPSILELRELAGYAEGIGADGLFVITPYASAHTIDEVERHYADLADRSALPLMMYNCPGYSGVNIPPPVAARLAALPTVVATKEGQQDQLHETVRYAGVSMSVFTARDSYLLPSMIVGAQGVVSFAANVAPGLIVELYEAARSGDLSRARELHAATSSLVEVLVSRSYPVMIKEAMAALGLPSGPPRRVAGSLSRDELARMTAILDKLAAFTSTHV
jgi:4-hydroxy-tetrahydrodipicolinate synthase